MNRRQFIAGAGVSAVCALRPKPARAAPTAPVAVARCRSYGDEFLQTAAKMFDQLGGLGRLVKGKTVAVKVNLTGTGAQRFDYLPAGRTHWTHPRTAAAVIYLLHKAGARRIRVLEGAMSWPDSLEEFMLKTGWNPNLLLQAAPGVEMFNTNLPFPGGKPYTRFTVPNGGLLFPAYDLNTAYAECDVFVTLTKIKEHATAGLTLSMKNSFGITPCTIYGNRVPEDEPAPIPYAGRQDIIHRGSRQPPKSAPQEKDPSSPRDGGYRVPRCVADLAAARPIHLCILDGIETIAGAELPRPNTRYCAPGIVIAGTNCVTTDAVAAAIMGFDPMADRGTPPFERCDSTLRLAEELGVGTRDLKQIEVIGVPIEQARISFREVKGPGPGGNTAGAAGQNRRG